MRRLIFLVAGLLVPALLMAQLNQDWVSVYNVPIDQVPANYWGGVVGVDADGYVYVNAYGDGPSANDDYVTVKYDPATGATLWASYFNGLGNREDQSYDMAVDASGNSYVTGRSRLGTSYEDYEIATVKYDRNGVQQWVARQTGDDTHGHDYGWAIAVDASGNSYVAGFSASAANWDDFVTIKYDPAGNKQWVGSYTSPGRNRDQARDIVVDASGNVYVTGFEYVPGEDYNIVSIKYSPSGVQQWIRYYKSPDNRRDEAHAIALDALGNVYVTGFSAGGMTADEYVTIKYDPDGVQQWVAGYSMPGHNIWIDQSLDMVLDASGNVYVTGFEYVPTEDYNMVTIKYDPDGVRQWVTYYKGPDNHWDEPFAVALDGSGNPYVAGFSASTSNWDDCVLIKYDPDGVQQWVAGYTGPGHYIEQARDMVFDASGSVYLTGIIQVPGIPRWNVLTIKYSRPVIEAVVDIDPDKLNLKSKGQWVTGYIELPEGFAVEDIVTSTVAISAIDGDLLDPPLYREGPTEVGDNDQDDVSDLMVKFDRQELVDILIDMGYGDGDRPELALTGQLAGDTNFSGVDTIELLSRKGGGQGEAADLPRLIGIEQTSPNPFRLATSLRYGLPTATHVRLEVYSPTGQRVATLVNGLMGAGYHNASWNGRDDSGRKLAAGIYLCRFEAGTCRTTRKTQLLR
jgi:uncharacterized delta-60 repeat protein